MSQNFIDEKTFEAARNGDEKAVNAVAEAGTRVALVAAKTVLHDMPDLAKDAAQETMVYFFCNGYIHSVRDYRALVSLIRAKARNLALDILHQGCRRELNTETGEREFYRRQTSLDEMSCGEDSSWEPVNHRVEDNPSENLEQQITSEALAELLMQASETERNCIIMHYLQGKSHKEVAEELGLSYGTVKNSVSRGIHKLQNLVRDDEEAQEMFR